MWPDGRARSRPPYRPAACGQWKITRISGNRFYVVPQMDGRTSGALRWM
jgi:hypothetical protein